MKKTAVRAAFVASFLASSIVMAWSGAAMAAGTHCTGVFKGKTPNNPIMKVADKTEAYAGQTVTFTISFKSTGPASNVVTDCYRVDGGSNSTLNALVTGFNASKTTANKMIVGTMLITRLRLIDDVNRPTPSRQKSSRTPDISPASRADRIRT